MPTSTVPFHHAFIYCNVETEPIRAWRKCDGSPRHWPCCGIFLAQHSIRFDWTESVKWQTFIGNRFIMDYIDCINIRDDVSKRRFELMVYTHRPCRNVTPGFSTGNIETSPSWGTPFFNKSTVFNHSSLKRSLQLTPNFLASLADVTRDNHATVENFFNKSVL